ncbi:DUF1403 family protein [Bosea sp. 2KB_26]|uniref:DUF1403 family protein n=1 Tax=Bosea sp. 2KB_26 TaxID=3237475 RepID=UPI003F9283D3
MLRRVAPLILPPSTVNPVPGWVRTKFQSYQELDAAFQAGASLAALDPIARDIPAWSGVFRQRLALQAAAASLRLLGRREDQNRLRDVQLLRRAGDDPGPAGRVLLVWRQLVARSPDLSHDAIARAAAGFGLALSATELAALAELASEAARSTRAAIVAVVELSERVVKVRPDAEVLALWLADAVLAQKFRWPVPVPLLAMMILDPAARVGTTGKRPRPGGEGWQPALALAYAQAAGRAIDLAGELARRAEILHAAAPKLRAKGAGAVIAALLNEDALAGSVEIGGISDRGLRRLFDRLVSLGAVRELSGRPTFRLYGL